MFGSRTPAAFPKAGAAADTASLARGYAIQRQRSAPQANQRQNSPQNIQRQHSNIYRLGHQSPKRASSPVNSEKVALVLSAEHNEITTQASKIFDMIKDAHHDSISKLDLLKALVKSADIANFVLPGVSCCHVWNDTCAFDAVNMFFNVIAHGRKRIGKKDFVSHFVKKSEPAEPDPSTTQAMADIMAAFKKMDKDGDGAISKLDMIVAAQTEPSISSLILPGQFRIVTRSATSFDALDDIFTKMSAGKKRAEYRDFVEYFTTREYATSPRAGILLHHAKCNVNRGQKRVLIIAPGFGRELNPRQCSLVTQAGFQIQWVNVPNPETPGFLVGQYLGQVKASIDQFRPDLLACASKGGHYVIALWQTGLWRGATLMLNAHPSLRQLPPNAPIVIAHGSNDELYPRTRADLEQLIQTGSPNMCFLYLTVDSGKVGGTTSTHTGDKHNMDSLQRLDCLPRLMDAALSSPPEMHMLWSWRAMLSQSRIAAEEGLGYTLEDLRRFWVSSDRRGLDDEKLHTVPPGTDEFAKVCTIFMAAPSETWYRQDDSAWRNTRVLKVERIENGLQEVGSAKPYNESLRESIESQGLAFEPLLHNRWAFHGTDAIESIVNDPMTGFQPLKSGSRLRSLWGSGTYFARDAKYVVDAGFCNAADGSRRMLMCLLMTGMSCVGDPAHNGILPYRQKPHRYNSSVDCLCMPEVFVMQHPSSAHPAYVITFA
jgi:hypothetical protein